ncbi:MAG: 50S ribosomal protein L33 [Tenericutes bacterium]|nr:MAG: 50S ribosomal protein L33 [Mycoplasmatota bacterium]
MASKKVALACSECKCKNYHVHKSSEERLVIKKFCRKCGRHTEHKEEK